MDADDLEGAVPTIANSVPREHKALEIRCHGDQGPYLAAIVQWSPRRWRKPPRDRRDWADEDMVIRLPHHASDLAFPVATARAAAAGRVFADALSDPQMRRRSLLYGDLSPDGKTVTLACMCQREHSIDLEKLRQKLRDERGRGPWRTPRPARIDDLGLT